MPPPLRSAARRTRGVFAITLDGEAAGSEAWTLDRDGVTLQVRSTITMRLPEPNRQDLSMAAAAGGLFLKLEVTIQLGDGERRAVVQREDDVLRCRVFEENAPAYENDFSAAGFDEADFGSILMVLPLLASGRPAPAEPCERSALLLTLPDLRPLEVRQSFRDEGFETVVLADGQAVEARRVRKVTLIPEAGSLESLLWVDGEGLPVRQVVEHGGHTLEVALVSREDRPRGLELPVVHAG
jgi:hypothetical protein